MRGGEGRGGRRVKKSKTTPNFDSSLMRMRYVCVMSFCPLPKEAHSPLLGRASSSFPTVLWSAAFSPAPSGPC